MFLVDPILLVSIVVVLFHVLPEQSQCNVRNIPQFHSDTKE